MESVTVVVGGLFATKVRQRLWLLYSVWSSQPPVLVSCSVVAEMSLSQRW